MKTMTTEITMLHPQQDRDVNDPHYHRPVDERQQFYNQGYEMGKDIGMKLGYSRGKAEAETVPQLMRKWAGNALWMAVIGSFLFAAYAWGVKDGRQGVVTNPDRIGMIIQTLPEAR
jgi:hypothetical protein